jgi:hypothetical protein
MRCVGGGTASESIQTFKFYTFFQYCMYFSIFFVRQMYNKTKENGVLCNVGFSVHFISGKIKHKL